LLQTKRRDPFRGSPVAASVVVRNRDKLKLNEETARPAEEPCGWSS
jgi:hypothetical protein